MTSGVKGLFVAALVGAVAAVLFIGTVVQVEGHAYYDHSTPASGAVLNAAPSRVETCAHGNALPGGSEPYLNVVGPGGQDVDNNDRNFNTDDQENMYITLRPNLGPGTYTVQWETQSAKDGHIADGTFSFTVAGGQAATPTPGGGGSRPDYSTAGRRRDARRRDTQCPAAVGVGGNSWR